MRDSSLERQTNETAIRIKLGLDGTGTADIVTGIGFFDHMLSLFVRHGFMDMVLTAKGDLSVDAHHTVEDVGIVIGQALREALGDRCGIRRYGTSFVPMDEALVLVSLDISGRPFLAYAADMPYEPLGGYSTALTEEFLRALCVHAGLTLHVRLLAGKNAHHMTEAIFKALGRAVAEAISIDARVTGVLSTKGLL